MTRQSLVRTKSFYVVIKYFYVATALAKVKRIYVTIEYFFCRYRVWPWMGFLCCDRVFLCRDRVWPRQEILGHDRVFSCHDLVLGKCQESLRCDREFDVAIELPNLVSQPVEPSVATESSRTWGFHVAT